MASKQLSELTDKELKRFYYGAKDKMKNHPDFRVQSDYFAAKALRLKRRRKHDCCYSSDTIIFLNKSHYAIRVSLEKKIEQLTKEVEDLKAKMA